VKEQIAQQIKKTGKQVAKKVAEYYANVVCPLVVYQPKMNESVKKLRKF
jgi:cyclic lactone autoinducer peptide